MRGRLRANKPASQEIPAFVAGKTDGGRSNFPTGKPPRLTDGGMSMARLGMIVGGIVALALVGAFVLFATVSIPAPKSPIEKQIPNEKLAK